MRLFDRLRRHRPDIETLSAYLDERLDARAAHATEAHLAACRACREQLAGLRETRSMLRAMPEAEPPRSFRLREADVRPAEPKPASTVTRWMPALSAAAVVVFAVLVGVDLRANAGSDERLTASMESADGAAADSATELQGAAPPDQAERYDPDATPVVPSAGGIEEDDGADREPTTEFRAAEADRQPGPAEDDGDGDLALRIAEGAVAAVALGAAGASVIIWRRRRGV